MSSEPIMLKEFLYWIAERYSIYIKKKAEKSWPWTKDEILQSYRFCNVFREDDTETRWIHDNWVLPNKSDKDLWFYMAMARFVNWHETLEEVGYGKWSPDRFTRVLHGRRSKGLKVFTGAYIVSTNGLKMDKAEYIAKKVLHPLWRDREHIRPTKEDSLSSFFSRLNKCDGMGSFMSAQVIADIKHSPVLNKASDWHTWASSGPGSRRGLNRIYGRDKKSPWKEDKWLESLQDLYAITHKRILKITGGRPIDNQNLQNCLCEFDKYMRVKSGEGRPRSRYRRAI